MEGLAPGSLPPGLCREAEGGTMWICSRKWHRDPGGPGGLRLGWHCSGRPGISASGYTSCVSLGKTPNLSEPSSPYL